MTKGYRLNFTAEQENEIARLYIEEELTILEVAQKFGVSFTGMNNAMHRMGVPLRDAHRKWSLNPHVFDSIDNEHAAYWHGFIYADGYVSAKGNYLQVYLSHKDAGHLQKLCDFMGSNFPIKEINYPSFDGKEGRAWSQARVAFIDRHLSLRLQETGIIVGRNTIDTVLANVPEHLIHHWIRGLFDGDGSASTNSKTIWFCGEERLMFFIRDVMARCAGRNPKLPPFKHKTANLYYMRYKGGINAIAVADYMYKDATVWLERKRDTVNAWPPYVSLAERSKKRWADYREKRKV